MTLFSDAKKELEQKIIACVDDKKLYTKFYISF